MTQKKSHAIIIVIGFCLFLLAGIVLHLAVPDAAFSATEKRPLETFMPPYPAELTSGRFMSSFERYANDQFPFRAFFVGLKSTSERAVGKFDNGRVWFGRDGYLFEKKTSLPDLSFHADALRAFAERAEAVSPDSRRFLLIAPTATTEAADRLPPHAPVIDQLHALNALYDRAGDYTVVDTAAALNDTAGRFYYRTDHHWTSAGAKAAYDVYAGSAGLRSNETLNAHVLTDMFLGTTYAKAATFNPVPDTITIYVPEQAPDPNDAVQVYGDSGTLLQTGIYDRDKLSGPDPYLVFIGQNTGYLRLETNAGTGRTLLLIKDSYANSMVPFLTASYDTIHVIDLRFYNRSVIDLLAAEGADDILFLYNFVTFSEDTNLYRLRR